MSDKQVRAQYTREFKLEAVRQVRIGQATAVVAKVLGIPKASLANWVRLAAQGALGGSGCADKADRISPEQMEIARLRAEVVRLRMERATATKPCWRISAPSMPRSRANTAGLGCTKSLWPAASGWAKSGFAGSCSGMASTPEPSPSLR